MIRGGRLRVDVTSLRARLLLLVLLAVIPVLAVTVYTNTELRRVAADDAKREALRIARIAANDQRDSIRDTQQLLYALAQLPEAQQPRPDSCTDLLSRLFAQYPQYAILALAHPNGDLVCATPMSGVDAGTLTEHTAFRRAVETATFAVEDFLDDEIGGSVTLDVAYPVLADTGEIRAVAFASIDLAWLNQLATAAQLPEGSSLTVIDQRGMVLVRYPEPQDWIGRLLPETPLLEAIRSQQGLGTIEAPGLDAKPRLFAFVPLFGAGEVAELHVAVGIPSSVAFAETNRVFARSLWALGFVFLITLTAAWVGSDVFVLRRVRRLVDVASRLGEGDMATRTSLSYEGDLGQLALAFDRMAEALTQRVSERDRAEAALRESRRAIYTLMSNLPGMAYRRRTDAAWTMEFASEGAIGLTGYGVEALTAGPDAAYARMVHAEDRDEVYREIRAALAARGAFEVTYRIVTAAGEVKWVSDKGRGVGSSAEDIPVVEGFVSDVTERVQLQQVLEKRVADRTRDLSALYDVMAVLNASLDLDTILRSSLERIVTVLDGDSAAIHLLDDNATALHLAAAVGACIGDPDELAGLQVAECLDQHWPLTGTLDTLRASSGRDVHPMLRQFRADNGSYVGVPLRSKGRVLGTLGLVRDAERPFRDEEVSLVRLMADEIGVAVDNARLQAQAKQLAVVQERERLARELHDSVTQSLYSLTLLAEAGRQRAQAQDTGRVTQYLERLSEIGQQALKEMRLLVYELRPLVLRREGLAGALQQRLDAVEKRAGVHARLLVENGGHAIEAELPTSVETAFYRIALEALNNTLKHAGASEVLVRLSLDAAGCRLEVTDNGRGYDRAAEEQTGGLGLVSMHERAAEVGAELAIETAPGHGTKVVVQIGRARLDEHVPGEEIRL